MTNLLLELTIQLALTVLVVVAYHYWRQWMAVRPPTVRKSWDEVFTAVHLAYVSVGLPSDRFAPEKDLARTGKLYEVLHHAAMALGKDHELRTVQDVVDWLHEAPGRNDHAA